jgi:hypothetical protein
LWEVSLTFPTTPYLGSVTLHFAGEAALCHMERREKSNFRYG